MAFTGGAVVVKMRDFSSKGGVGDVQEVVGVDVVRHETIRLRDEHGGTRTSWSRSRLACLLSVVNNLRSLGEARLKH